MKFRRNQLLLVGNLLVNQEPSRTPGPDDTGFITDLLLNFNAHAKRVFTEPELHGVCPT